jgi:hypothetical protein
MARRKPDPSLYLQGVTTADDLKTIYAAARAQCTRDDPRTFTNLEECVPVEQVIAELEAIARKEAPKRKKKKKKT